MKLWFETWFKAPQHLVISTKDTTIFLIKAPLF